MTETTKADVVKEDVKEAATKGGRTKASKSKIPEGATVPQDHRTAKQETDTEDENEVYEFEWKGETYHVDQEAMDDVEVMEFLTDDNTIGALRLMLQEKDWVKYKAKNKNAKGRTTASGANEFLEHIFEVLGSKNS